MDNGQLNWITNFIWGIADDVLRDIYVRGKYRDVILPMTVIRRLDGVLEPTKQEVLEMKKHLDAAGITNQDTVLLTQPAEFRRRVIIHDLIHLKVPNHSKLFRALEKAYLEQVVDKKAA
jgi:type I restriction enzyme M protein